MSEQPDGYGRYPMTTDSVPISERADTEGDGVVPRLHSPIDHPLYVDLDGTLYPGDSLWDTVALVIANSPLDVWKLPAVLLSGPLPAKQWLVERVVPDPSLLPYRDELVALCRAERRRGRRVILATAAHRRIAEAVAGHLGCFDAVIATDVVNRKGTAKLAAIREDSPTRPFLYAGDSESDTPIWSQSAGALAAGAAADWPAERVPVEVLARFPDAHGRVRALVKALRPHQWVKNILVFVPLVASHRIFDADAVMASVLVFLAFCLAASSAYLLNDLVDLENDRAHHRKRRRPLAAGTLPVAWALPMIPGMLVAAVGLTAWTTPAAVALLLLYYLTTVGYSIDLKKRMLVDVFTLAGLYTLRCLAGHAATGIPYSPWLIGFTIFLFLSLAFAKRHSELFHLRLAGGQEVKGRGYHASDLELISTFGVAAGFLAALVLGLYVTSDAVTLLYGSPIILWALCPLVLYWISRVWLITHRGQLHDDPIVFALRDRMSYLIAAVAAALLVVATLLPR